MSPRQLMAPAGFGRFALVGLSGVGVDMAVMHWLTSAQGWDVLTSKVVAGELALLNNFLWNDVWTFAGRGGGPGWSSRLLRFHGICLGGFILGTALTWVFWRLGDLPIPMANAAAILVGCAWNYAGSRRWGWRTSRGEEVVA